MVTTAGPLPAPFARTSDPPRTESRAAVAARSPAVRQVPAGGRRRDRKIPSPKVPGTTVRGERGAQRPDPERQRKLRGARLRGRHRDCSRQATGSARRDPRREDRACRGRCTSRAGGSRPRWCRPGGGQPEGEPIGAPHAIAAEAVAGKARVDVVAASADGEGEGPPAGQWPAPHRIVSPGTPHVPIGPHDAPRLRGAATRSLTGRGTFRRGAGLCSRIPP